MLNACSLEKDERNEKHNRKTKGLHPHSVELPFNQRKRRRKYPNLSMHACIDAENEDRYPFMNPWPMRWAIACSVWTTDADGDPKVRFVFGETVYVRWSANGMVNMTVYAPDGVTTDWEWVCLLSSGVVSFVPSHGMGIYEIDCTGARSTPIAISTFLVIPQLPFMGTLLALVTMLGAVFIAKKRRSH